MANVMIDSVGQPIPVIWKNNIVPKSPIEQPSRHQDVLTEASFQV